MSLYFLIAFYLIIAGSEIAFTAKCLFLFEKLTTSAGHIRLLSILIFAIAFLYYIAEPSRLQWVIAILFWIYLLSGIWFLAHPQSIVSLCNKSYSPLSPAEKCAIIYADCGMRTAIALLLIYAV